MQSINDSIVSVLNQKIKFLKELKKRDPTHEFWLVSSPYSVRTKITSSVDQSEMKTKLMSSRFNNSLKYHYTELMKVFLK